MMRFFAVVVVAAFAATAQVSAENVTSPENSGTVCKQDPNASPLPKTVEELVAALD
jgi:hypothetical protein